MTDLVTPIVEKLRKAHDEDILAFGPEDGEDLFSVHVHDDCADITVKTIRDSLAKAIGEADSYQT